MVSLISDKERADEMQHSNLSNHTFFQNQNDGVWTADDIRENASSWSLQADGKLLEYMQNISKVRPMKCTGDFVRPT